MPHDDKDDAMSALERVRETRRMLQGREDESFHIPPATALTLVYECLDKAEAALSAPSSVAENEALRLLGEWLKKAEKHPEGNEFRGGYQPFLARATREYLSTARSPLEQKEKP